MSQSSHSVVQQIEEQYRKRTPRSAEYHRAAQKSLPGGDSRTIAFFGPYPPYIEEGQGQRMTDVDGNVYLDFLGNYTSMIHGHGHPAIARAIAEQAAKGTCFAANAPVQIELAEELCSRIPSVDQVRFCNSGTEGTMYAIRAARAFTGRDKIIKMEGGYHGTHDAVQVSVHPSLDAAGPASAPNSVPDQPGIPAAVVEDIIIVPLNNPQAVEDAFASYPDEVAAVIVEPVLGATGTIPADESYLRLLRELCDKHGALLIFDEVITLRLDYGGAQTMYGVIPDLTAVGKIIGGGLPVGAFGGRQEVMDLFAPPTARMMMSGTYNANPITMAAGLVAMQLLTADEIARINQLGSRLATGLRHAFDEMQIVGQVTGTGSLQTIHFTAEPVRDFRSMAASHAELQRLTHLAMINRGIFAAKRDMFVISTPMTEDDVDACVAAFAETLGELRPYIADEAPHLLT